MFSASAVAQTVLETEAATCLEYLKPRLADPRAAYFGNISKDGTVLKMTLYGRSAAGTGSPSTVACEIKHGRLDADWTKIHLDRLNWR